MTAASQRGVSMIEILVVVAIFALIAAFGMMISFDSYRGSNFRNDRNLLIAALQRARAQSMNNMCLGTCTDGKVHGVAIRPSDHPDSYVIFQTSSDYAGRGADSAHDVIFPSTPTTVPTGASEVVFARLTGNSTAASITLTGSGRTSVISINAEGAISWTN